MTQVNMLEAKTDLSKLVKMLETRQEDVIYLARNGIAVAQMTLIPKNQPINESASRKGNSKYRTNLMRGIKKLPRCSEEIYENFVGYPYSALGNH